MSERTLGRARSMTMATAAAPEGCSDGTTRVRRTHSIRRFVERVHRARIVPSATPLSGVLDAAPHEIQSLES
jgi:hypothetical protein